LKKRGVRVLLSNSSAPFVRELYAGSFEAIEVYASRAVNCRSDRRGAVKELLLR
jgi:DNA adenine methylase